MNGEQTDTMLNLIIENLHLIGYKVISIDENTTVLQCPDKTSVVPTEELMSFFQLHINFIKHMLDKLTA